MESWIVLDIWDPNISPQLPHLWRIESCLQIEASCIQVTNPLTLPHSCSKHPQTLIFSKIAPNLPHSWEQAARLLWLTAFVKYLASDLLNLNHSDIIYFLNLNPSRARCIKLKRARVHTTHIIRILLNVKSPLFPLLCTPFDEALRLSACCHCHVHAMRTPHNRGQGKYLVYKTKPIAKQRSSWKTINLCFTSNPHQVAIKIFTLFWIKGMRRGVLGPISWFLIAAALCFLQF